MRAARFLLALPFLLPSLPVQSTADRIEISIDGGGGRSGDATFMLESSVAQPDAGAASVGDYQLELGFQRVPRSTGSTLFHDGFEAQEIQP